MGAVKTERWVVQIEFLDHARGQGNNTEPVPCVVWGLLAEETKTHYKIVAWLSHKDFESEDTDGYAVLKRHVTKLRRLSRVNLATIK